MKEEKDASCKFQEVENLEEVERSSRRRT